jgi:hypothetical protein
MAATCWRWCVLASLVALLALGATQAGDVKPTDEGKADDFKGKAFDLKEKGKAAIILEFSAGKEFNVTVRSDKNSDVNLYIYDAAKKLVAKDDSPGPSCDLKFAPKEGGKYLLEVVNLGPGENRSTLKVEAAKK